MIGGERFLLNRDSAPVEGFGRAESLLLRVCRGQVVQYQCYLRVIGTQPVLCDRESLGSKLLRFGISLRKRADIPDN